MNRGDVWLTRIGRKRRPVVVMTRDDVLGVREFVTDKSTHRDLCWAVTYALGW